ncbi:MAG TPA: heat-inducible transcriptional repressor HrcA [Myxococcales bacterium LLY-WYZ-16_1]|nr:heat-inducible transcriptional repressor HrcA [Myxococcales bacterium LLY-WYZ-16_1]
MSKAKAQFEDLTERHREILTAILEDFIATAEPVGSRSLTRRRAVSVSPATVRNAMADLEEMGLLSAPHASAGRVPTVAAFRIYVERLAQRGRISSKDRELVQALSQQENRDLKTLLAEAGRVLSSVSRHASLVLMPAVDEVVFDSIEFMPLRENAVLTVFVAKSGLIQHRVVDVDFPVSRDELARMSNYLKSLLGGKVLAEVRQQILRSMADERSMADAMMRQALDLGQRVLGPRPPVEDVLVEGERTFLDQPEFADIAKMRRLLRAFEEKTLLLRLLDAAATRSIGSGAASRDETMVILGSDASVRDLQELAAVTATYATEDGSAGRLAILGPTRMDYSRVIPLVEMTAQALSDSLGHSGNGESTGS